MKWYITGGRTETGYRDDRRVPPLVSYGVDRLEAVANAGITVWSEEEYREVERVMAEVIAQPSPVIDKAP